MISIDQLNAWMTRKESEHLEFKEAKEGFDHVKLIKYCCAISSEGGGHLILGISDKIPRKVVGCRAFSNLDKTKTDLISKLHIRIDIEEIEYENQRVLVFTIPGRPMPIQYEGAY